MTPAFLGFALGAHIVGSLLRFIIIQAVYHGVADANGYYGAGVRLAPLFRSFQFPPLPQTGTSFMNWCTGLLFADHDADDARRVRGVRCAGVRRVVVLLQGLPRVLPGGRPPPVRVADLPAADDVVLAVKPRQGRAHRAVPGDRHVRVRADPSVAAGPRADRRRAGSVRRGHDPSADGGGAVGGGRGRVPAAAGPPAVDPGPGHDVDRVRAGAGRALGRHDPQQPGLHPQRRPDRRLRGAAVERVQRPGRHLELRRREPVHAGGPARSPSSR